MNAEEAPDAHPRFGIADLCEALLGEHTRVLAEEHGLAESDAAGLARTTMNRQAYRLLEMAHNTTEDPS
ncbi:hypothetical protein QX204_34275 (plasmid) [Nocardia sp. PE-7]|uniref:hypothetical protein n=1 Tax=Nocardia sp. PE-7 TaxID=3058426 RepID=UPI00265A80D7|nr:hypothetical protein [Nocardia sp. PE-7]WKG13554.1 hypothetical protein QX204_34275 [Nocardia sp. PE-7]